jgi:hypothetical protein
MARRSLADHTLEARIGLDWGGLIGYLEADGSFTLSRSRLREKLKEEFDLTPWWLTTIVFGLDERLSMGLSNRQRNSLYRQTSQRRFREADAQVLFSRFCAREGLSTFIRSDPCVELVAGTELRTSEHLLRVTDLDEVGWVRIERWKDKTCSLVHCSFRTVDGKTSVTFAESDLPSQVACHQSSQQWNLVLDQLQL